MSLLGLAMSYVWRRRLASFTTIGGIALGAALVLVILKLDEDVAQSLKAPANQCDLIAGAAGSEAGMVLAALFHVDRPRGNIPYRLARDVERQQGVTRCVPIALGDQVGGFHIVGTTPEYFQRTAPNGASRFALAQGRWFERDFELVVGSEAARRRGLDIGAVVPSSHGQGARHDQFPYKVVGVLEPTGTPEDRGLFASLGSYWKIHGQPTPKEWTPGGPEPEVTLLLLDVEKPRIFEIQRLLSQRYSLAAVRPLAVIQELLTSILDPIERVLLVYGWGVVLTAMASVMATLYLATLSRGRDIALLRALGASPQEIFGVVFLEAVVLVSFGAALGICLSQLMGVLLRGSLVERFGMVQQTWLLSPRQGLALMGVIACGLVAALVPAAMAYRSEVASGLRGD